MEKKQIKCLQCLNGDCPREPLPARLASSTSGSNVRNRRDEARPVVGARNRKRRVHIENVDASVPVPDRDHRPRGVPAALLQPRSSVDHRACGRHFRVAVEVPDVKTPGAVDRREHGRVDRRPADIADVVRVVFERQQRPRVAEAPQLHGPVDGRREEVGGQIDWSGHPMAVDSGDRAVVGLKGVARGAGLGTMARPGVRDSVLTPNNEVVRPAADKREAGCGDGSRLVVLELHGVLWRRQHVQTPEAHPAVSRDGRQAVGVGRSDDVHTVDRVGVSGGRHRRALDRSLTPAADIPQHDLPKTTSRPIKSFIGLVQEYYNRQTGTALR